MISASIRNEYLEVLQKSVHQLSTYKHSLTIRKENL